MHRQGLDMRDIPSQVGGERTVSGTVLHSTGGGFWGWLETHRQRMCHPLGLSTACLQCKHHWPVMPPIPVICAAAMLCCDAGLVAVGGLIVTNSQQTKALCGRCVVVPMANQPGQCACELSGSLAAYGCIRASGLLGFSTCAFSFADAGRLKRVADGTAVHCCCCTQGDCGASPA
jgi:hypothetical protein